VAALVEGSVQRQGDTLRINAELIRVADGSQLWSRHYDRKAQDVFAIQDEIANAVTRALVGKLLPSSKAALARRGTDNLDAYKDYIQGRQAMNRISMDSFKRAEKLLLSAVRRDPHYVAAMLDLAQCWGWEYSLGAYGVDEFQRRAGPMLDRVDALEPGNARVLALRGWLAQTREEGELAIRLVDRAVALAPDDYGIRINAAGAYAHRGDLAGTLRHQDRMVALDPLNPFGHAQRAMTLEMLGRLDEAQAAAQRALQLAPDDLTAMAAMANIAVDRHDLLGGLVWAFRIFPRNSDPGLAVDLAFNLDAIGEPAAADAWIAHSRRLQPEHNVRADSYQIDRLFIRGDNAGAMAASKAFLQAHRDKWEQRWDSALETGCAAAARIGKLAQMRDVLVRAGFLPAQFDAPSLRAWAGPGEEGREKLERLDAFGLCTFSAAPKDATRRDALRAVFAEFPAATTDKQDVLRDARFREDRATLGALLSKAEGESSWYLVAEAERDGVTDDPRVQEKVRKAKLEEARTRAGLPAALAKAHVSMLPPPADGAGAAPAAQNW
jgi:tetratricopeptide (TPR) repeat protein